MANNKTPINKQYIIVVSFLTFFIPLVGFITEYRGSDLTQAFILFGKWFIFSAVGLRLLFAGIRQITKPGFTAKEIFHIDGSECWPLVRELGFANLCFGLVGIISLFKADWRMVSAFASGLYYLMAGLLHLVKKPVSTNEKFALWTDMIIFLILAVYFYLVI
jgi:hypothetical protein